MALPGVAPGQIWQDDCYYLDRETGACQRKYVLILALAPGGGDSVTACLHDEVARPGRTAGLLAGPTACGLLRRRTGRAAGSTELGGFQQRADAGPRGPGDARQERAHAVACAELGAARLLQGASLPAAVFRHHRASSEVDCRCGGIARMPVASRPPLNARARSD